VQAVSIVAVVEEGRRGVVRMGQVRRGAVVGVNSEANIFSACLVSN